MGGSGGGGGGDTKIRYAGYIEDKHNAFLKSIISNREYALAHNPYTSYVDLDISSIFYGAGYTINSYPGLFALFQEHMEELDSDALWGSIFADTVTSTEVTNLVKAESALLDDDIDSVSVPRLQAGMRDINAIMTSSFPVAASLIESTKVKAVNKYSAELQYKMVPIAHDRWTTELQRRQQIVTVYAELVKFLLAAKHDVDEDNYSMAAKEALWPFTVLDFERAALGALQGATNQKTDVAGASTASRTMSGALSGAAAGAMIGSKFNSTYGTAIGAVVGAIAGGVAGRG